MRNLAKLLIKYFVAASAASILAGRVAGQEAAALAFILVIAAIAAIRHRNE